MINLKQTFNNFMRAFRFPFRGELKGLNKGAVQTAQINGLSDETLQKLELYQHFGFTSGPPPGSQVVIVPLEGQSAHSIIVATEHGAYRLDVGSGESCFYNQWGAKVHLKKERIIDIDCDKLNITAKDKATINTKLLELFAEFIIGTASKGFNIAASSVNFGGANGGDAKVTMTGGLQTTQDVVAGGVSVKGHQHRETGEGGGTTGPPVS